MIDDLRRLFPKTKNEDLAEYIGVSQRTLVRKARELRLEKDSVWMAVIRETNRRLADFEARRKGYPGGFVKGHTEKYGGEFKKGHRFSGDAEQRRREGIRKAWVRRRLGL